MLDDYSEGNPTSIQNNAVATLMSHVGIGCSMNYAADESGQSSSDNRYAAAVAGEVQSHRGKEHRHTSARPVQLGSRG